MTRPLGKNQEACLRALRDTGSFPGGWVWDNTSTTVRILESLVRLGLARKAPRNQPGDILFNYFPVTDGQGEP